MSNNNQKEMTISALAQEMRSGFQAVREEVSGVRKEMREKISRLESYMRQGFELMDAKIDAVDQKIEHKIEFLQEGLFTPDEKKSLFDTVKPWPSWEPLHPSRCIRGGLGGLCL